MTWTSVTVGSGGNMDIYVERPEPSKAPAVIVLQELFGVNAHIRDVARRVAGLGYLAVAPDLFHRTATRFEGPYDNLPVSMAHARKMTPDGLEADLRAAYEWLGHDEQADGECVAAWGFCMGGRVALLADAILPLRAAVSFYGGVTDALLPQLPKLSGPVLLAWGGLDKHLGPVAQRRLVDALKEAKKRYVDVEFSDADHGFFCDQRPTFDAQASALAWGLTSSFLAIHLR